MNYTPPPFTITPKILDLVSQISEVVGKLEVLAPNAISPMKINVREEML